MGFCVQALDGGPNLIYALHGFLGEGSDWDDTFKNLNQIHQIICPSYFSTERFYDLDLKYFIQNIEDQIQKNPGLKKIFVGYSLGGRIGLRLLEVHPNLFDHYVFISTHPGLVSESEKENRKQHDQNWIDTLQNESWPSFLSRWNAQDVLKDSESKIRIEKAYSKERLVFALSDYSLGQQKDYSDLIRQNQNRLTWIVGDQDLKFIQLAENLKQKKILLDYKRISSVHRILLDNPKELSVVIQGLLN